MKKLKSEESKAYLKYLDFLSLILELIRCVSFLLKYLSNSSISFSVSWVWMLFGFHELSLNFLFGGLILWDKYRWPFYFKLETFANSSIFFQSLDFGCCFFSWVSLMLRLIVIIFYMMVIEFWFCRQIDDLLFKVGNFILISKFLLRFRLSWMLI